MGAGVGGGGVGFGGLRLAGAFREAEDFRAGVAIYKPPSDMTSGKDHG